MEIAGGMNDENQTNSLEAFQDEFFGGFLEICSEEFMLESQEESKCILENSLGSFHYKDFLDICHYSTYLIPALVT